MRRLLTLLLVASFVSAACGSDDGGGESGSVAEAVEEQLGYLDPDSALVVAVDLRYEEENWESLRGIADRTLEETREVVESPADVPDDAEAGLTQVARGWNLSFDDDLRPLLTGHLLVGMSLEPDPGDPEESTVLVFRSAEGGVRDVPRRPSTTRACVPSRGTTTPS